MISIPSKSGTGIQNASNGVVVIGGNTAQLGGGLLNTVISTNGFGLAIGRFSTATGADSFAAGEGNDSGASSGVALGSGNQNYGQKSVAIGYGNISKGFAALALGNATTATNNDDAFCMAIGMSCNATADYSGIIGISPSGAAVINNSPSLWLFHNINSGKLTPDLVITDGAVGVGNKQTPTARLHIQAGTAAAGTAPLKIDGGVLLATKENGAIESDGTYVYFTNSAGVRKQFILSDSNY